MPPAGLGCALNDNDMEGVMRGDQSMQLIDEVCLENEKSWQHMQAPQEAK